MNKDTETFNSDQTLLGMKDADVLKALAFYKDYPFCSIENIEQFIDDRELTVTNEKRLEVCEQISERMGWFIQEVFQDVLGDSVML